MDGEIIEKLPTLSKRNELIAQIDILLNSVSKNDIDELTELGQFVSQKASSKSNKEEYLQSLRKEVLGLPVAELVIAFAPNNRDIKEIASSIRNMISPNIIVDIVVNPYIMGGAVISFNGLYYDGSLAQKIRNV